MRLSSPDSLLTFVTCVKMLVYQIKNTVTSLITVSTKQACQTIYIAAKTHRPQIYAEIHDFDRCCYQTFTYGYSSSASCTSTTSTFEVTDELSTSSDFPAVINFIKTSIIQQKLPVSMKVLQGIYGGRKYAVYTGKLKDRINREFPDKLLYFQSSHNVPKIIVSK